jgi:hypothetical protein
MNGLAGYRGALVNALLANVLGSRARADDTVK